MRQAAEGIRHGLQGYSSHQRFTRMLSTHPCLSISSKGSLSDPPCNPRPLDPAPVITSALIVHRKETSEQHSPPSLLIPQEAHTTTPPVAHDSRPQQDVKVMKHGAIRRHKSNTGKATASAGVKGHVRFYAFVSIWLSEISDILLRLTQGVPTFAPPRWPLLPKCLLPE